MDWLRIIILSIAEAILKVLTNEANKPDTAVDADRNPSRRERLLERVRAAKNRLDPGG